MPSASENARIEEHLFTFGGGEHYEVSENTMDVSQNNETITTE